jgi:hypothetical protein
MAGQSSSQLGQKVKVNRVKGDMWHDRTGHMVLTWKHPKVSCGTLYTDWAGDKVYHTVTWPYRWTNRFSTDSKDRPMRGCHMEIFH